MPEEIKDTYKHAPLPWVAEKNKIYVAGEEGYPMYHVATCESTPDMGSPIEERASRTAAFIVELANQTVDKNEGYIKVFYGCDLVSQPFLKNVKECEPRRMKLIAFCTEKNLDWKVEHEGRAGLYILVAERHIQQVRDYIGEGVPQDE